MMGPERMAFENRILIATAMAVFHAFVLLTLAALTEAMGELRFDPHATRSIRRRDFYEIATGAQAYFLLFYLDDDPTSVSFAPAWNQLAADMADQPDVVFLQINCEYDPRFCRQQAVQGFPTLKVYQNGEVYVTYRGVFFVELVREFVQSVSHDLLQETVS